MLAGFQHGRESWSKTAAPQAHFAERRHSGRLGALEHPKPVPDRRSVLCGAPAFVTAWWHPRPDTPTKMSALPRPRADQAPAPRSGPAPRRLVLWPPPRSGQPGGLGEISRGLSDPTGAIPPVARRRGSHPGRGAGTVAAVCDHRCRRVWVGHGGHRLPLQCAGLNGRSASTLLFVGGGRLRSVQACNSIPRPSPRPRVGPGMPK